MLLVCTTRGAVLAFCDTHCRDNAGYKDGTTQAAQQFCLTCFTCAATHCVTECQLCSCGWSCSANAWLASIEPVLALLNLTGAAIPITDEVWAQLLGFSESVWDGNIISDMVRRGLV